MIKYLIHIYTFYRNRTIRILPQKSAFIQILSKHVFQEITILSLKTTKLKRYIIHIL